MNITFSKVLPYAGIAGMNSLAFYQFVLKKNNHHFYNSLSENEKKGIFERCAEQKLGPVTGVYGAMEASIFNNNPAMLKDVPIRQPFQGTQLNEEKAHKEDHSSSKKSTHSFNRVIGTAVLSGFFFEQGKKRLQSSQPLSQLKNGMGFSHNIRNVCLLEESSEKPTAKL